MLADPRTGLVVEVDAFKLWDGSAIGRGPIALLFDESQTSSGGTRAIIAASAESAINALSVEALPRFFTAHESEIFVTPGIAVTVGPLNPVIGAVIEASRWVDLGLLDLLVRVACGDSVFKLGPRRKSRAIIGKSAIRVPKTGPKTCQICT